MNPIVTLDKALDTVMQLPPDQQEMLVEIVRKRHIEKRRQEMASAAQLSIEAVKEGHLTPQPLADIIDELRQSLNEEDV